MTLFNYYDFNDFWNLYDKKICRFKCEKKWNKLSNNDKRLIMQTLPDYIKSTPVKRYRKNPETYINNQCWHDEIIFYEKAKNITVVDAKTVKPMTITEKLLYGTNNN